MASVFAGNGRWTGLRLIVAVVVATVAILGTIMAVILTRPTPAERLAWTAFRDRFISAEGRVADTANGNISHSEGQGYAMLLAVAADDPATFERLWRWTQDHLTLREDGLRAWKWVPGGDPAVPDPNAASDGDLLIAWALLRAGDAWERPELTAEGRTVAQAVAGVTLPVHDLLVLLPGPEGFGHDEAERPRTLNPSYWIFPALTELAARDPGGPWAILAQDGRRLLERTGQGTHMLPPDWIRLAQDGTLSPPDPIHTLPWEFGFNALRVPFYLIWDGEPADSPLLAPYARIWGPEAESPALAWDFGTDTLRVPLSRAWAPLAALVQCHLGLVEAPQPLSLHDQDYYDAVIARLVLLTDLERDLGCFSPAWT